MLFNIPIHHNVNYHIKSHMISNIEKTFVSFDVVHHYL